MSENIENPLNHLKKFETKAEYDAAKKKGLTTPNVSYVESEGRCYYNPVEKKYAPPSWMVDRSDTEVGDIVLYDPEWDEFRFIHPDNFESNAGSIGSSLKPIGIVAIPQKYAPDDGDIRVMSLVNMAPTTPERGDIDLKNPTVVFGPTSDIPGITNIITTARIDRTTGEKINGGSPTYYPIDRVSSLNYIGPNGWEYYSGVNTNSNLFIGPHHTLNGAKNPMYYSATDSATSDFDGVGNTQAIVSYSIETGGSNDWRTSPEISKSTLNSNYPAAFCCLRFKTSGTMSGDWYLPALGEALFMSMYYMAINRGLNAVSDYSTTPAAALIRNSSSYASRLWSSSERDSGSSWSVNLFYGNAGSWGKTGTNSARAFLRI